MWILTGPFDEEGLPSLKSKLLKTGHTYPLGRKNQPLLVPNKKVSQLHCRFSVEEVSLDDVHNPEKRPSLTIFNERDKAMMTTRAGMQVNVEAKSRSELEDGDVVVLVTGLTLTVKWQSLCCYSPSLQGRSNVSLETCCQLGISIVYTPNPHVTHHILPTYIANAPVATSLVSAAQFVRLEWLLEILKNVNSLEENFVIPNLSKYRPSFSPSLNPSQKVFKVWEPNEERLNMFSEYRFLVFGEKAREVESDLRELIKRAGGFLETFDIAGGTAKLHRALTRGKAKEGRQLVVVADAKDMTAAIGHDEWKKLVIEVQSFELYITHPDTVVQSVIDVNPSLLATRQPSPVGTGIIDSNVSGTSLPICVPNSIPDEPSIAPEEPPARKRLLRRGGSRQPSVEPMSQDVNEEIKTESPRPRRLLLSRRGKTVEPTDGADASSKPSGDQMPAPVPPTPGRLHLKRRLGTTSAAGSIPTGLGIQSQLPDVSGVYDEPPLKKFKALFDASDPDRAGIGSYDDDDIIPDTNHGVGLTTQTQSQSEGFVRRRETMPALREEEEESLDPDHQTQRGTKRTLDSRRVGDRDMEMIEEESDNTDGEPARKKQASESGNHVQNTTEATDPHESPISSRKEKERQPGAPVGRPDTDAEFLKAVASTRKGKRTEDAFDREFNNLRISKPQVAGTESQQRREEEEEWRRFADFGDDSNLRGNFMVVLEMDVCQHKKGNGIVVRRESEVPDKWKDKPDFKKFKKKALPTRRPLVELVVSEDNDFDAGPVHWRSKKPNQTQRTASFPEVVNRANSHAPPFHSRTKALVNSDDESGGDQPPTLGKRSTPSTQAIQNKPSSRAGSQVFSLHVASKPSSRASSILYPKRTASRSSGQALFLISDDETGEVDELQTQSEFRAGNEDEDETEQTLRSSGAAGKPVDTLEAPRTTRASGRKRRAVGADDDSDDGAVFKGFGASRKRSRK